MRQPLLNVYSLPHVRGGKWGCAVGPHDTQHPDQVPPVIVAFVGILEEGIRVGIFVVRPEIDEAVSLALIIDIVPAGKGTFDAIIELGWSQVANGPINVSAAVGWKMNIGPIALDLFIGSIDPI